VAVRDVVMALAAFTLARLVEIEEDDPVAHFSHAVTSSVVR
jgi:hypothetical protein